MSSSLARLKLLLNDPALRSRLIFTLVALALFRLFSSVPMPGLDSSALASFFAANQFFGLINIFTGGGLAQFSIVALGVGPYITASIIMQLATIMSPRLKAIYHEEGEAGRRRFNQYSRILSVPMVILQGLSILFLFESQGLVGDLSVFDFVVSGTVMTGGALLLIWLGELITEFGLGNGVSLIIFAGIVASLPAQVLELAFTFEPSQLPMLLGVGVLALAVIAGIVAMTEAERPIPVTYAKRVRGMRVYGGASTYLPLRLNQAGVIPIIFALSIMLFPSYLLSIVAQTDNIALAGLANAVLAWLDPSSALYAVFYFVLVFLFTFFYTAITFEPETIAQNLQKSGAFIPGVRPGAPTVKYIGNVVTRITFVGAFFLGIVAVLPIITQAVTGVAALAIGGTALLIVIQVVLDLARRLDAQMAMREY